MSTGGMAYPGGGHEVHNNIADKRAPGQLERDEDGHCAHHNGRDEHAGAK